MTYCVAPLPRSSIMASPSSPVEDFDFVEEPSRDFFCPVTLDLLREPHQTLCCGNHISPEAVATLQESGKPCPLCKEADLKTLPDKFFKRKVNELKVRCPLKSAGCLWVGELGGRERHLSVDSADGECKFVKIIACTYQCGKRIPRSDLPAHKARQCPKRPFKCQYTVAMTPHSLTSSPCTTQFASCSPSSAPTSVERRRSSGTTFPLIARSARWR